MNVPFSSLQRLNEISPAPDNTCAQCSSRTRCLPYSLDEQQVGRLDKIIGKRCLVRRNELLIRVGEPFHCLHIIHGGQFKTFQNNAHGKQSILGFHMSGEILGMNAISTGFHEGNAMALEDSEVCKVPFLQLLVLCAELPLLQQHFHRILSEEINRGQRIMRFLGTSADTRFAIFLIDLSTRFAARGYSRNEFKVLMSREEIGNYLGLSMESVSRLMSKFRRKGWITTEGRNVSIRNYAEINAVANEEKLTILGHINPQEH